jgi:LemA protein
MLRHDAYPFCLVFPNRQKGAARYSSLANLNVVEELSYLKKLSGAGRNVSPRKAAAKSGYWARWRNPPMSTSTLIVLAVIVVVILWAITIYNGLVSMRQRVNGAFADVDVQLRQRHDLVPNLVEAVKGYAAHERGTLDEVVKARNTAVAAQGPAQQAAAENMLSGALRQLFALAESYPDLKASANFQQLQAELTDIENKIAAARRFFNDAVQEYNTGIQRFPAALFASAFGFAPKEFFDLGDERKTVGEAPQVKF